MINQSEYVNNINISADAYLSAEWNIQICKSGDTDGIYTKYPFGTGMKKNAILDSWLSSVIFMCSQQASALRFLGGVASFATLTEGYMQLGTGIKPIEYSDLSLSRFKKETDYIRPFYARRTGFYIVESGMAKFRRSYDFTSEIEPIKYTEAGFRSYASSVWGYGPQNNAIWSRFLFTAETGSPCFLSGYMDDSGIFRMFPHEIDQVSGVFVNGAKHIIGPYKSRKNEKILGFRSGYMDQFGIFTPTNEDVRYNLSGYFVSGVKYNFNPITEVRTDPITGFISGFSDEFGNFSGFNDRSISGTSGYFTFSQSYNFKPTRYFDSEKITGFISGSIDKFNNFSGHTDNPVSGYNISGQKYVFPTGDMFSGFSGQEYFYDDWGYNYSGFNNINSGFSGDNKFNEKIIGYISGYLNTSGVFSGLHRLNPSSGSSGYFIDDRRFQFPSVGFNGFENQYLFNKSFGYKYTGFSFVEGSGFSGMEFGDSGLCMVTGFIGDRNYYTGSGDYTSDIGNRVLLKYSGTFNQFNGEPFTFDISTQTYSNVQFFLSGTSGFSGIDGTTSGYGILTGLIGHKRTFYKSGSFDAFENKYPLFEKYLGYKFTGFALPEGSQFSGAEYSNSGYGQIIGAIGDRNTVNFVGSYSGLSGIPTHEYGWYYINSGFFRSGLPNFTGVFTGGSFDIRLTGFSGDPFKSGQKIIGFRSGFINEIGSFVAFTNTNIENFTGYSGYYLNNKQVFFRTGINFSGFSGENGFDSSLGFRYTGFSFPEGTGFSGYSWPVVQKEMVFGFLSGFMNEYQEFFPYQNIYPELSSSGYFVNTNRLFFKTGSLFSGFDGENIPDSQNYEFSGFFIGGPSGFSGISFTNSGSGIVTGLIGYKNIFQYPISGSGILTGFIGDRNVLQFSKTGVLTGLAAIKNYISGIELEVGDFVRLTYETAMRIPALVEEVPVTGNNLVYGDFNASGRLKLVGLYSKIFGSSAVDGESVLANEGFWWPMLIYHHARYDSPYDLYHLSANMLASGVNQFPPPNQIRKMTAVPFPGDEESCLEESVGVDCSTTFRVYRPVVWAEDYDRPAYPLASNGLAIEYYNGGRNGPYPMYNDFKLIFPAEYPNVTVTGFNGFMISYSYDGCPSCGTSRCSNQKYKPYPGDPEWWAYPCTPNWTPASGVQNGITGTKGVGWVYIFDTPQLKYEDQKIELDFRFSMTREVY
jgi:hypothetical protein